MTSIGLLFLFIALTTIDTQNTCSNSRTSCINIRECPLIIEILRNPRPLEAETLETLRDSQCGFQKDDPLVCCVIEEEPVVFSDPPDVSNHWNLPLLEHQTCGPMRRTQQKIFNGYKTGVFEYPWMALIMYDTGKGIEFRSSGTIISKRYILTAAHCVTMLPSQLRLIGVRVGDHDVRKERDCEIDDKGFEIQCAERYQDFGIGSVHYHPQYTTTNFQNDIALIRLNNTIDFRPFNVRAICMPIGSTRMLYDNFVVTGWGVTELGSHSQDLLQAKLPPVNIEQCKEIYKRITQVWYKQICAGGYNNVDSCVGDSGGPLQAESIYNNAPRMVQYGIISYGLDQCGTEGFPGVYTNIAYYMDWILDTMRE